jgi:hypothetical protein
VIAIDLTIGLPFMKNKYIMYKVQDYVSIIYNTLLPQ